MDDTPMMELNRELIALRRAQLILNGSPTASMADKKRITERVKQLMTDFGLVDLNEEEAASPMF